VLSIVGLSSLLYAIIEAPVKGWGESEIVAGFVLGGTLLIAFFLWERHSDHPMLDVKFFRNPRFTAASNSIMAVFFAMFGAMFLITQYFQFVLGYTPLETGIRFLPWAACMMIMSPLSPRIVERVGTKLVVGTGLLLVTASLLLQSRLTASSSYFPEVILLLMLLAVGMGLTMAPATESIMGSLPLAKAGVGSAVNDTTRQVGGALGVAIIGSVLASTYGSQMSQFLKGKPVPEGVATNIKQSLGFALDARNQLSGLASTATHAFVDGMRSGMLVAAAAALLGAVIAFCFLPARAVRATDTLTETPEAEAGVAAPVAVPALEG
jgi:Na+/melibiose symporter-like transporter